MQDTPSDIPPPTPNRGRGRALIVGGALILLVGGLVYLFRTPDDPVEVEPAANVVENAN